MGSLDQLSRRAGQEIERRRFLARLAAWGAGVGAALVTPGVLRAAGNSAAAGGPRTVSPAGKGDLPSACAIFCYIYDCCSGNCCVPNYPKLYKCVNNCDGSYFYACGPSNCQGFCYSFGEC
ncbi:MAG: hypothetical protein WEE67_04255 [Chloroflexota bacterium]